MGRLSDWLVTHPRVNAVRGVTGAALGVGGMFAGVGPVVGALGAAVGVGSAISAVVQASHDVRVSHAERMDSLRELVNNQVDADLRPLATHERHAYAEALPALIEDPHRQPAEPGPGELAAGHTAAVLGHLEAPGACRQLAAEHAEQLQAESFASLDGPQAGAAADPVPESAAVGSEPAAQPVPESVPEPELGPSQASPQVSPGISAEVSPGADALPEPEGATPTPSAAAPVPEPEPRADAPPTPAPASEGLPEPETATPEPASGAGTTLEPEAGPEPQPAAPSQRISADVQPAPPAVEPDAEPSRELAAEPAPEPAPRAPEPQPAPEPAPDPAPESPTPALEPDEPEAGL